VINVAKLQIQTLQSSIRTFVRDFEVVKAECTNFMHEYAGAQCEATPEGTPRENNKAGASSSPSKASRSARCRAFESPKKGTKESALKEAGSSTSEDETKEDSASSENDDGLEDAAEDEAEAMAFVEDVMKIRGVASRRLRCMRIVVERLVKLMKEDLERTVDQATTTLRFCGMSATPKPPPKAKISGPLATLKDLPLDLELLFQGLAEFAKVFKHHWDEVNSDLTTYQKFFGES